MLAWGTRGSVHLVPYGTIEAADRTYLREQRCCGTEQQKPADGELHLQARHGCSAMNRYRTAVCDPHQSRVTLCSVGNTCANASFDAASCPFESFLDQLFLYPSV